MKVLRKCSLTLSWSLMVTSLLLTSSLLAAPAHTVYSYGYKKGDKYDFSLRMSSTTSTQNGTSTASMAYTIWFSIENITENLHGHNVDIEYLEVVPTGGFMELGQGSSMYRGNMEGDPQPFVSSMLGQSLITGVFPVSPFVTTNWTQHEKEWKHHTASLETNPGYTVESHTESNRVFTVDVKLDFDSAHSDYDFDGDGTKDAYNGTTSIRVEYDANGVLSSSSTQGDFQAGLKGSVTESTDFGKAQQVLALSLPSDVTLYAFVIVIAVIALFIGFFWGRRKTTGPQPSPPPPPQPTQIT